MTDTELRELAAKATPGPWTVWAEQTPTIQDAIAEFAYQVSNTPCFSGTTWLLNANGLCPASTGCGATSEANAAYIAAASPDVILSLLDRLEAAERALPTRPEAVVRAAREYVDAVEAQPELDAWDTEDGKEAPGAERFASDWSWKAHDERKWKTFEALQAALSLPVIEGDAEGRRPTHRHKKRGTEYALIGVGKMQAEHWIDQRWHHEPESGNPPASTWSRVDMREVSIYRSVDDGSLWVRPVEQFEDGRFEALPSPPTSTDGGRG